MKYFRIYFPFIQALHMFSVSFWSFATIRLVWPGFAILNIYPILEHIRQSFPAGVGFKNTSADKFTSSKTFLKRSGGG